MSGFVTVPAPAIPSPCIDICRIEADRHCAGCHRTLDEIARWTQMPNAERRRVMADLPRRREIG